MDLNVQEWKEFNIKYLFEIEAGNYYSSDEYEEGKTPYVSASSTNNGVGQMINLNPDFEGNQIVTGKVECKAFYQGSPFSATSDVNVFTPKFEMSKEVGLFLTSIISFNENGKWSYGRQCRVGDSKGIIIRLPVQYNEDGSLLIDASKKYSDDGYVPDWEFMENYIKFLHSEPITTKISGKSVPDLDIDKWEEFHVGKIFTLMNGKGITKEEIELNPGDLPAIQSGEENNGVLGKISESYCREMKYTVTKKQCLTVARTGSAGFVSYQGKGCVVGDSAKILLLDDDIANVYVYLFLQTMLTANRFKYDYGRKVTESKYLDDILKLPVLRDCDGKPIVDITMKYSEKGYIPDWEFMENYIRSLPYSDRL